jgi:hypothetical protein
VDRHPLRTPAMRSRLAIGFGALAHAELEGRRTSGSTLLIP